MIRSNPTVPQKAGRSTVGPILSCHQNSTNSTGYCKHPICKAKNSIPKFLGDHQAMYATFNDADSYAMKGRIEDVGSMPGECIRPVCAIDSVWASARFSPAVMKPICAARI